MSQVKMQHYVPRFYLRNFAMSNPQGDNPNVFCFSKPDRRVFTTGIANIAGEKFFYDLPEDTNQEFENALANIEGDFSDAYDSLIDSRDLGSLTDNDKYAIAYSIGIQELRTRARRDAFGETSKKLLNHLEDESLSPQMEEQLDELRELASEEGTKRFHVEFIANYSWEVAEHVLDLQWILCENKTQTPYWTSDNPIIRHNDLDFGPYGNLGLRSKGIQIYFPLTPDLVIGFIDPELYQDIDSHMIDNDDEDGRAHIRFFNSLQVRNSTRHVISNEDDFELAENYLDEYPEYADPERDRVNMRVGGEEVESGR